MAKVYHAEIFGLRETKYDWLNKHNINNVKWNKLEPQTPFYFLIPRNEDHLKDYQSFTSIQEIFPINVTGIVTARDKFVIDFDELVLKRRIEEFRSLLIDNTSLKNRYKFKDTRGWKFIEARKALAKDENWNNYFAKILYRPFDVRSIYYSEKMIDWGRQEVMRHMLKPNISLCFMRQVSTSESYTQVLLSEHMVDNRTFFSSKGIIQQAPLYIYPETDKKDLFSEHETGEKKPNIKPELFEELKTNFQKEVTPEEIFYYIYAVLYSNTYRTKYAEFLKIDFPRVPFTKDYKLFIQLGKLGKQLADLHLLKSKDLEKTISKFQGKGNNKVEKLHFDSAQRDNGKVWINKEQYFDGIKEEVWQYQIGGYQVCEKWLKDRKDRTLTLDEIKTYCKIVTALSKTIELQKEIDKNYEQVEKTV
jgi:predicted helicase